MINNHVSFLGSRPSVQVFAGMPPTSLNIVMLITNRAAQAILRSIECAESLFNDRSLLTVGNTQIVKLLGLQETSR